MYIMFKHFVWCQKLCFVRKIPLLEDEAQQRKDSSLQVKCPYLLTNNYAYIIVLKTPLLYGYVRVAEDVTLCVWVCDVASV